MGRPKFIHIDSHSPTSFRPLLGPDYARFEAAAERAREAYEGRAIWHVSSTFRGGGVAEILRTLLPYVRGARIDTRWVVLRERAAFFELTKRIHNNLHGAPSDGGPLGAAEQRFYGETLAASSRHFARLIQPGDVVFLHDPQTAGLIPAVKRAGARAIWRCHIGCDEPNETALAAQRFLEPWVAAADNWVFSRDAYVWAGLDPARTWTMAPSIDPLSPKNQALSADEVAAIVGAIGLARDSRRAAPRFTRADGTPARVERSAEVLQVEPLPQAARLVTQISRWDRLKDHHGLLRCFAEHLGDADLRLLLAGPATAAVADDPEGARVWEQVRAAWRQLPEEVRRRVHLVSLPMADLDENGAMVNALQHRAQVVVQKSLAEGFGLTVAEAMWKRRAVVGSRVGGIQDQIVDGESGLLVPAEDLAAVAAAIRSLVADPALAHRLGRAARQRVRERFLGPFRLAEYAELLAAVSVPA
ncbi:MAG: glycosyltransferase [Solirubrobacterales bacterium]